MSKLRMLRGAKWMPWFETAAPSGTGVLTLSAIWGAWLWPSPPVKWLYAHRGEAR